MAAAIPAMTRPRPALRPRAAAAGLAKAGAPGTGAWAIAWGAGAPAPLPDRSVPQVLQNLLPSGFLVPQLGQNMGASRIAARDPAHAVHVDRCPQFYIPAACNGQVPHPARTPTEVGAARPHVATHPMSSSAAMGVCSPATLEREGAIRISQHETSIVLPGPVALLPAGVALEGPRLEGFGYSFRVGGRNASDSEGAITLDL